MITRKRSKRKQTGGLYQEGRKKRKSELGRLPANTRVGETRRKQENVRGKNVKDKLLQAEEVNLWDGKKHVKAKVKTVKENVANRNYVRRNILTKGAVVETDKGDARITSRPGQAGSLNATLVKLYSDGS